MKITTTNEYVKRINMVIEYINNHIDEEMCLKTLADISNFSEYHFHRIFKTYQGETLGAYISRIRIERAAILLKYTKIPIESISNEIGYTSSAFSRAFKLFFNSTPIKYRSNYSIHNQRSTEYSLSGDLEFPKIYELENKLVIYTQLVGITNGMHLSNAYSKLWYFIKKIDMSRNQPFEHIAIYYDDPMITAPEKFRLSVCLSINQSIKPNGEVGIKKIKGGLYAIFRYCGSYLDLEIVYNIIFKKWLPESRFKLRNEPFYEKFMNNPFSTDPKDLITEIYIPIY